MSARALAAGLALVFALLPGCGGSDDADDDSKSTQPPDCQAKPELCQ